VRSQARPELEEEEAGKRCGWIGFGDVRMRFGVVEALPKGSQREGRYSKFLIIVQFRLLTLGVVVKSDARRIEAD
jgi:hypothetical protein